MTQDELGVARLAFVHFLEQFLEVKFKGFQSGGGLTPDYILYDGPALDEPGNLLHGQPSTLAVPTTVMLLPQEQARIEVKRRWAASYRARRCASCTSRCAVGRCV